uniref:60S ribosomal export protein NMD3 n=1 Tax=Sinocyclocheilus grahami TaxID=75366 RepID=A0A672MH81_SINGR
MCQTVIILIFYMQDFHNRSYINNASLCCMCGIAIPPNPANMCVSCLRNKVDISEGIPKQVTVHFCRQCERYLQPPGTWLQCALESRELLALCLKKLKASMSKVRLIDAGFLWTEPHSKRIKMKLTIQKEVMSGAILQQVFVVEFVVQPQMCEDCHRVEAKDFWKAVVQVRQKVHAGDTCLEQSAAKIKRTKTHNDTETNQYSKQQGKKRQIISMFSLQNYVLLCAESLYSISPALSLRHRRTHANIRAYVVSATLTILSVDGNTFWRHPFSSLCSPRQLEEFMVMDIDVIRDQKLGAGAGLTSNKVKLLHTPINNKRGVLNFFLKTKITEHLNTINTQQMYKVLIKKSYDRMKRVKNRVWKLRELDRERDATDTDDERQYTEFLEDLEEDEMLRKNVNIFRDASKIPVESETDDDGAPRISLAEMMEDLSLSDSTGGAGADMMTD